MLLGRFLKNTTDLQSIMGKSPDFKQLLDSLTTAVMLVDEQLRLTHTNPACETLLQISLNHVYGAHVSTFFHESEQALGKVTNTLKDGSLYTKRKARWRLHNDKQITGIVACHK